MGPVEISSAMVHLARARARRRARAGPWGNSGAEDTSGFSAA